MKAFTLLCYYRHCVLAYSECLTAISVVLDLLERAVTHRGLAKLSRTIVRVVSINSAYCSMSVVVQSSPSGRRLTVARCHAFAASFPLSSEIVLMPHPIISWLMPTLLTILSGSSMLQTMTS